MVTDKGKKPKTGEKTEVDEQIDAEVVQSVEKLQEIQDELEKINEEVSDKILEIEQKYYNIRKPVYDKRNEIIKSIPDFWLTAFLAHPALSDLLNEEDQKIFKHLTSLEVEDSKDMKSGYTITFMFSPNPYFENEKLTKSITFLDEGTTKVSATPIMWKEGMGLSNGVEPEKNGNKRPHEDDSFFSWFSGTQRKEDVDEIQDGVAEMIREDLWVNPLAYFSNDADEEDFDEEDTEDEEDIGTDDSDEEEEEGDEDQGN
ncbi:NAP1-related protein 2-like [Rutidosis leptorrhynchoides]|uniref:NAP1-related protein 2-like n=1 Tax=Rutidosis leptorrhynchoides TaxID=125765 RepID=UPI003A99F7B1